MQDNAVVFVINKDERIKLFLSGKLDDIFCWDYVNALYIKDHIYEYKIYEDFFIFEFIEVLDKCLKSALSGNCKIDASLQDNLGYEWNIHLHDDAKTSVGQGHLNWIGKNIKLWNTHKVTSWLYEKDGKFYFEITPLYRWHDRCPDAEEKAEYITYKQFMKDYKTYPVIVAELSVEAVHAWRKQLQHLTAIIDFNEEKHSNG